MLLQHRFYKVRIVFFSINKVSFVLTYECSYAEYVEGIRCEVEGGVEADGHGHPVPFILDVFALDIEYALFAPVAVDLEGHETRADFPIRVRHLVHAVGQPRIAEFLKTILSL